MIFRWFKETFVRRAPAVPPVVFLEATRKKKEEIERTASEIVSRHESYRLGEDPLAMFLADLRRPAKKPNGTAE